MANDSLDFVQRGKVSIVKRQYADAVKICRLGLLAHPHLLEGRLVLGMALTALQRWDEVLAEMRVALETDGNSALAWLLKGEALVGKGDYQQAEQTLLRAKELDPSNTKADQLLAEIHVARAAGFEGTPAEPTDTKVYPARASADDAKLAAVAAPFIGAGGTPADVNVEREEPSIEYEDTTEVDPDPSDPVDVRAQAARPQRPSVVSEANESEEVPSPRRGPAAPVRRPMPKRQVDTGASTFDESEDTSTENFVNARGGQDESYEPPAHDDYAERARPRVPVPSLAEEPSEPGMEARTPIARRARLQSLTGPDGRAKEPGSFGAAGGTEPSIELSGSDLMPAESSERFDLSDPELYDEEEEETFQRQKKQVDENAGTKPEAPEPVVRRSRPLRPFEPGPPDRGSPRPSRPAISSHDAPTGLSDNPPLRAQDATGATPGVVRVPIGPGSAFTPPSPVPTRGSESSFATRLRKLLLGDRGVGGLALFVTALVAVVALGVVTGLIVRELRLRGRVAKRHDLARQKLGSGNYPGFQAAETQYRNILSERDDPLARALRARTLAQMAFEFGDAPEPAARALAALGDAAMLVEAEEARVYLALARGDLDQAQRLASALRRKHPDATSAYLLGRAELLLEHPDPASEALRMAAEKAPRDALVLHALGLAEAAARREPEAMAAYRRALDANANHIATIVDRALLQLRRPEATPADRDVARGALEGVVQKLVGDAAPSQLARAFLGLAELGLGRGDLEAGRKALASAVAKRREGDASLSEELARAAARAFDLDLAEKEAKRALAGLGQSRVGPRIVLGDVALKRGRPAQALQQLDDVGRQPDGLLLRARANLALGKNEAARVDTEEALRVAPELVSAKVLLARLDHAEGHPERALRELDRLDRTTRSAEAAYALGEALAPRFPERGRHWLTQALARDPLLLEARLKLARLFRDQNRLDEARTELIQTTSQNPAYVPALRDLAALALDQGDAVTARDQFEQLVSGEPDVATWVGAARAHLALGDPAGALERVHKAQEQKPTGSLAEETADTAARAHLALHQPGEAVALLKPLVSLAARAETGGLLMLAHLDLGQPERAAGVILQLPPRLRASPEVLTARARLLVDRARDSVAEGFATAALAKLGKPTAPRWVKAEAQAVLGRAQWNQGSMKLALKSLKAATELDPAHRTAFYYLGLVYEELGRFTDGRDALEQAVKNDPKFEEAWYYLGELRRKAGDDDYADAYKQYLGITNDKGLFADDARRWLGDAATRSSSGPRRKRLGR